MVTAPIEPFDSTRGYPSGWIGVTKVHQSPCIIRAAQQPAPIGHLSLTFYRNMITVWLTASARQAALMLDIVYRNTAQRRCRRTPPHVLYRGIPLYSIDPRNHFSWNRDFRRNHSGFQRDGRAENSAKCHKRGVAEPSLAADQLQPLILGERLDAQLRGFAGLRARIGADDDVVGLFRHRARDLRAQGLGAGLGLVAGHLLQAAREHHGLALDRRAAGLRTDEILDVQFFLQLVQDLQIMLLAEKG